MFLLLGSTALAANKTCPAPKLCDTLGETLDTCEQEKRQCSDFAQTVKKLLPKYDCQRPADAKTKTFVPAIWLCGEYEDAVRFLSKLKTDEARKVFGSAQFRSSLENDMVEEFSDLSKRAEKENVMKEAMPTWTIPKDFEATANQKKEIEAWFKKFDELATKNDLEAMAAMAMFPLFTVTHDSKGHAYTEVWKKEDYLKIMKETTAGTPKDMEMKTDRTPYFLSNDLVTVLTRATVKTAGQTTIIKYADILVRVDGQWKFQTMAQAGWGDLLKARKK